MSMMEGGIRMPSVPPCADDAAGKADIVARLEHGRERSRPISVTTAPTMPVEVANSVQVISAATPMEPGTCRAAMLSVANSRLTMLARSTM